MFGAALHPAAAPSLLSRERRVQVGRCRRGLHSAAQNQTGGAGGAHAPRRARSMSARLRFSASSQSAFALVVPLRHSHWRPVPVPVLLDPVPACPVTTLPSMQQHTLHTHSLSALLTAEMQRAVQAREEVHTVEHGAGVCERTRGGADS